MEPIIERRAGGVAVVRLPLEKLDLSTVAEFKRATVALAEEEQYVALDMSGLAFVDSSGLGALLSLLRDLSARGGDLKLFGVQRRVRAVFELVRLHQVLTICEDEAAAVVAFTPERS
jgi:anti-sigma B factor antagonist